MTLSCSSTDFENDSDFRPSRARCCLRFRLCRSIRCVYRLLITCSFPFSEQLLRYFPYYLLVNSTFAVTAALGAAGLDSEANLMARVRTLLAEVRDQVTHKTCLNYVLESPYWNVKGNFFCYLNDHNENTIVDPSVIYFDFANPLQAQEV